MTERAKELTEYIFGRRDEFLSLLRALVEEETPSTDLSSFKNIFKRIGDEFKELDFNVKHIEGGKSAGQLLCMPQTFNPGAAVQLIVGHCDTVWSKGTLKEMPFAVKGNEASGPGIYDMKAGICMMICALRALKSLQKKPEVQPVFLISTDEETGSEDSESLIVDWARKAERCFVLEPSLGREGKIKTQRKGVGGFEVTITGKPSHAGLAPEEGVSAILGLSHIVQQLFELNDPARGVSVNVGTIEGGERSNVIAAKSKAVIDVRVLTREDGERISKAIRSLEPEIEGIEIEVEGGINRPPMEKTGKNEKLWQLTRRLGCELDLDLQEGISGGASDGNFTNLYSPTIDGLGAVGEGAHAWHEKILLDETLQRLALFALLLLEPSIDGWTSD